MTDNRLTAEIDDLILGLGAPVRGETASRSESATIRFIVATNWAEAAVPLTLLRAFVNIVPPGVDAQLVFAVPHDPTEADAECVRVLLQGIGVDDIPGNLDLASFDQVVNAPFDCAVVPDGGTASTVQQVGGVITRMHDVVRRKERAPLAGLNEGDGFMLSQRLTHFVD